MNVPLVSERDRGEIVYNLHILSCLLQNMDAWFIVIIIYSCEVLLSSITLVIFFFLPLFSCSKTYGWWTVTQMCGGIPRTFAQSVSLTTKASSCLLCTPYVKGQALCNKSVLQCITNPNSTAMRATACVSKVKNVALATSSSWRISSLSVSRYSLPNLCVWVPEADM